MAKKVLLISEDQIKNSSLIETNVDSKVLKIVLHDVQNIVLKPVLGAELFEQVIDAVYEYKVNATPIDAELKVLLDDYITPFLVHAVLVEFIVSNQYKLTNKGLLKYGDGNANSISSDELEYAKNYYDNRMVSYKSALIDYIGENKLVDEPTDTNVTAESIGWYLEGLNRKDI